MLKKVLLSAAVAVVAGSFISAPAQAGHCPNDVKKIEAAMSNLSSEKKMMMGKEKMMMSQEMSSKGMALHKAGKHGESLQVLHETMKTLGIKH